VLYINEPRLCLPYMLTVLIYEPDNVEAISFQPLIEQKLSLGLTFHCCVFAVYIVTALLTLRGVDGVFICTLLLSERVREVSADLMSVWR